jgi:hypothetical protein
LKKVGIKSGYGSSPFRGKKGIDRSLNKFPKKNKPHKDESHFVSDRDESFKMTYDNENQINFPAKSELSVKSSNTHKITSFNKIRKSDQRNPHGKLSNTQTGPRALLNPNKALALRKKHLRKKSLVL